MALAAADNSAIGANGGSGNAAGQTLWNGQTVVGTILPFGTGGMTGTGAPAPMRCRPGSRSAVAR